MSALDWLARACLGVGRTRSALADLMARDAPSWTVGQHYATHEPTGLKVWICNGAAFLRVEVPSPVRAEGQAPIAAGREWSPSWAERRLLWRAYRLHLEPRRDTLGRAVERLAQRHLDAADGAP